MNVLQRYYQSRPLLCWFIGIVLVPLIALFFYGYSWVNSTLPITSGNQSVKGIENSFTITKDEQGTAFIKATSDYDAFFAMGYTHAQDRLWQLELQRRMASGQLSEIFGKATINLDIYIRTLGIHKNAQKSWQAIDAASQQSLQAYAAGINSWLAQGHELPTEFTILDIKPSQWQPVDSLAWIKMFALSLAQNYEDELNHLYMQQVLDTRQFNHLTGVNLANINGKTSGQVSEQASSQEPAQLERLALLSKLNLDMQQQWQIGGKFIGSNAWAIGPQHSQSGTAVLANDPHLGLSLPSMWYAVNVKGKTLNVSGMSLVGLPLVMLGKNNHIAWGATNMMADSQDLFFQSVNTNNPNQYKVADKWVDFETHEEYIKVQADFPSSLRDPLEPVKITIRNTINGPVISDAVGGLSQPVSLKWSGSSDKDTSYQAFLKLNYAKDWTSFRQAMSEHISPAMNLIYIDKENNIGHQGIGRLPIRNIGDGTMALSGAVHHHNWQGFIPFANMPQQFNPSEGYVINANNEVKTNGQNYHIGSNFAPSARAHRIEKLIKMTISQGAKLSMQSHQDIQHDLIDEQALKLLPQLINVATDDPQLQQMLAQLKQWDGSTAQDSVAATVFFTWVHHLRSQLFDDEFKPQWQNNRISAQLSNIVTQLPIDTIIKGLTASNVDWCDKVNTEVKENCADIKLTALKKTRESLDLLLGGDVDDWQWGEAHHSLYEHQPFSQIRGLHLLYQRKIRNAGSTDSINVSASRFDRIKGFVGDYGAGFRQIMSFNSKQNDYHIYSNSTGQSGNVVSPNYDDMLEPFINGQYYDLINLQDNSTEVLTLTPIDQSQKGSN